MANDRLFIKNKISGKQICLAKHYGTGWFTPGKDDEFVEKLNDFFEDNRDEFLNNPHSFEITYENSDENPN